MSDTQKALGLDDYLAAIGTEQREILLEIRRTVMDAVPDACECISYRMPAFRLNKVFFYYAAFKKHIGVYPPVKGDPALCKDWLPYRGIKGNLQFPLNKPIPFPLIKRVAQALAKEYSDKGQD